MLTTLLYTLYGAGIELITWSALVPWTLLGPAGKGVLGQRLGRQRLAARKIRTRVLIHAVSVGEMVAAEVLIGSLARLLPGAEVIVTTGNRHGLEAGRRVQINHPEVAAVWFLPWDRWGIGSWLAALRPDLVAVIETEIWPNFFVSCRKLGIPLCLVNGRIYPADFPNYRLARRFFEPALSCVSWFGVQSESEKQRFLKIGVKESRITVEANLKFDAAVLPAPSLNVQLGRRPVMVAGSTHDPEEKWLLDALGTLLPEFPRLSLVLAPRHPRRVASIVAEAARRGFSVRRWSDPGEGIVESDVLILDTMGVLRSFYQAADLAVVGGSFAECGGHNLLEPAAQSCPLLMGPNYEHFEEIVEGFRRADAIVFARDKTDLCEALRRLLADPERRRTLGQKAQTVVKSRTGSADRYAARLAELLNEAATARLSAKMAPPRRPAETER